MERVVILAGSLKEANAYRRDKGIRATLVTVPAQLKTATHIIELPGFSARRDRFTLAASRDARLKFGRGVKYLDEADWTPPAKVVEEVEEELDALETLNEDLRYGDLADQENLDALKAALNQVGLTLKKLPKKTDITLVDAPVADTTLKGLSFPDVEF